MKRTENVKAAHAVIKAVNQLDFDPFDFTNELLLQPYEIKKRIDEAFLIYLQVRKAQDANPYVPIGTLETDLEKVDLTEFDQ